MITTTAERAVREAEDSDLRRLSGRSRGPLDGVPIVWKDVFDLAHTVTTCGSASTRCDPPAAADGPFVQRVTAQLGVVTIGKTNMSELAFSGLGINDTFGTPCNALDAALIPGGSSSGAAVAVASGIASLAIGTDTSGSVRVPAAFNGCVGYRASAHRYGPHDFRPLSPTLDAVGVLARDVATVDLFDRLMHPEKRSATSDLRIVVPDGEWVNDCTPDVRRAFDDAVAVLRDSPGVVVHTREMPSLRAAQLCLDEFGTIVGAEAYDRYHWMLSGPHQIESSTRRRLKSNAHVGVAIGPARDAMPRLRRLLAEELDGALLVCPTVRHEPPSLAETESSPALRDRVNASTLRTTMVLSYLGTCGMSLPLQRRPVGLLISAPEGHDARLLTAAGYVEHHLAQL